MSNTERRETTRNNTVFKMKTEDLPVPHPCISRAVFGLGIVSSAILMYIAWAVLIKT